MSSQARERFFLRFGIAPLVLFAMIMGSAAAPVSKPPHEDYVPDAKTAMAIAEAVSRGQVGEKEFTKILPFEVIPAGEVWRVTSKVGLGGDAQGKGGVRGITMDIRRDTGEIVFFGYYPFD